MSIVEELCKDVLLILDLNREYIEEASELHWKHSDGVFPLIPKTILRRQFDSLEAISLLVDKGMGFAAGPVLRPSCEEFIWVKYLLSIPLPTAEGLIRCMAAGEVYDGLNAQYKAAGIDGMQNLGLMLHFDRIKRERKDRNKLLREIGASLNWPEDTIKRAGLPSVAWLAKKTGERLTYDHIYAATSRFVHFSPSVLLKLSWYQGKSATITSRTFETYWSRFCLYWGVQLFSETAVLIYGHSTMPDDSSIDYPTIISAAKRIRESGIPPLITAEELETP